jgi:plasmid stabilization system protein ParE
MINDSDIEKAARYLHREHGENAAQRAESHASDLRHQGLDDIAEAWQQVAQRLADDPLLY